MSRRHRRVAARGNSVAGSTVAWTSEVLRRRARRGAGGGRALRGRAQCRSAHERGSADAGRGVATGRRVAAPAGPRWHPRRRDLVEGHRARRVRGSLRSAPRRPGPARRPDLPLRLRRPPDGAGEMVRADRRPAPGRSAITSGPAAPDVVPAAYHGGGARHLPDHGRTGGHGHRGPPRAPAGHARSRSTSPRTSTSRTGRGRSGVWYHDPPEPLPHECVVSIPPSTVNDPSRAPMLRWLITHEIFHCFQHTLVDYKTAITIPLWVTEGEANWVAEAITGGVGEPTPVDVDWDATSLHPEQEAVRPRVRRDGVLRPAGPDRDRPVDRPRRARTRPPRQAATPRSRPRERIRPRSPTDGARAGIATACRMRRGRCTTDTGSPRGPADGHARLDRPRRRRIGLDLGADPLTATISTCTRRRSSPASRSRPAPGGSLSARAGGLDKVVRATTLDLCTSPSGDCTCPPGSDRHSASTPQVAPPELRLAATGEEHTTTVAGPARASRWPSGATREGPRAR